ncbi:chorismate synthase [Clostridium facile]|uniref:Chorismate synthase n=1 Tax=Clostridium facile TaxID=2763035 RepID=A0ABR7INH4_9CLOT|nr:chorismate synthase [Clostridium facile]MBC5786614.1 chorismate synthase [Clostridium facile]
MSSIWNRTIKLSIFGESHGVGIGAVLDNLPPGEPIDMNHVLQFMARRAPNSKKSGSTPRTEADQPEILSGMLDGHTTGVPLCAVIRNTNTRSVDYGNITTLARPGHADFTGDIRYQGANDIRGGGHFSGRLTAPLVFAGAICQQILERRGIYCAAHILSIHGVKDQAFDTVSPDLEQMLTIRTKDFPVIDEKAGNSMRVEIEKARLNLDSVGGIIECMVTGVPAGIGSPMFDGMENDIASMIFGIPAVRGIEFGTGFGAAELLGSQHNDPFYMDGDTVKTKTNHHGGILGGITSGMPIHFKVAIKPTASISQEQDTVDYKQHKDEKLVIHGRHDSCIVVRAVPVVEAAANIAVLSQLMQHNALEPLEK